nr:immunoglobulin heavy chain junction region [Macaca mulatta]MOW98348.1 immunoglobulin heavy chain junction region [Macaca mulatta]MOW98516.1 immunoglobulin heavy chain junction region [Macaca mulatta]MOW98614.1 immunoglobulin heavy chain junction region [Macaca mulatta]MOX01493.1 immunoglobulin heavy chain junction region [Macaca mulatta]
CARVPPTYFGTAYYIDAFDLW